MEYIIRYGLNGLACGVGLYIVVTNYYFSLFNIPKKEHPPSFVPFIGGILTSIGSYGFGAGYWSLLFLVLDYSVPFGLVYLPIDFFKGFTEERKLKTIYQHPKSQDDFLKNGYSVVSVTEDPPFNIKRGANFVSTLALVCGAEIPLPDGFKFNPSVYSLVKILYAYNDKTKEVVPLRISIITSPTDIK